MVDATQAMESEYINVDLVRDSPTKRCVIISEGGYEKAEYNGKEYQKLNLHVDIDGKQKIWTPNKDSVKNIAEVYGVETKNWIGAAIMLRIIKQNGKDIIAALPYPPAVKQ